MSFDAGSISSTLGLDTGGFTHGMLEAEGITHLFPACVTEFLADPLLGWAELAKEAIEGVKEAFESIFDVTREIGDHFRDVGLAAQKAGVGVEWLSELQGPAQAAGVGLDQLITGLKTLEQRAEEASEGDKGAIEGFQRLGISAQEAAGLMGQPEQLFQRVKGAIDGLSNPSEKTAAALGVMGRQGFNLVPLLSESSEKINAMASTMKSLGAVVDEEDAAMGQKFGDLQTIVGGAWDGIKETLAKPILDYVAEHFDEILGMVKGVAGQIREAIGGVMPDIIAAIPGLIQLGGSVVSGIVETFTTAWPLVKTMGEVVLDLGKIVGSILVPAFKLLEPVLRIIWDLLKGIMDVLTPVLSGIGQAVDWAAKAVGLGGDSTTGGGMAGGAGGRGGTAVTIQNVNVAPIDVNEASTAIAAKIQKPVNDALVRQHQQLEAAASVHRVSRAL